MESTQLFLSSLSNGTINAILIAVLTAVIGLNGVVFEVKKDIQKPIGIRNLSTIGKVLILMVIIVGGFTAWKQMEDNKESELKLINLTEQLQQHKKLLENQEIQIEVIDLVTTSTKELVEKTTIVTDDIHDKTDDIDKTTEGISDVTDGNKVILRSLDERTQESTIVQNNILREIDRMKISLSEQISTGLIESSKGIKTPPKKHFANVEFLRLDIGDQCEADDDNAGDFYFELAANGIPLKQSRVSLKRPLEILPGRKSSGTLGVIRSLRILGSDDTILLTGYIRERDPSKFLRRPTYKYRGDISFPVIATDGESAIEVVNESDCQISLDVKVTTYSE